MYVCSVCLQHALVAGLHVCGYYFTQTGDMKRGVSGWVSAGRQALPAGCALACATHAAFAMAQAYACCVRVDCCVLWVALTAQHHAWVLGLACIGVMSSSLQKARWLSVQRHIVRVFAFEWSRVLGWKA